MTKTCGKDGTPTKGSCANHGGAKTISTNFMEKNGVIWCKEKRTVNVLCQTTCLQFQTL